jgi:hypothetical protein
MGIPAQPRSGTTVLDKGRSGTDFQVDIPGLNSLALRSLLALLDQEAHLFCERLTLGKNGYRRDGVSRKHTIIALLGLRRLATAERSQYFDTTLIEETAFEDRSWVNSAEDLGLLAWFSACCFPDRLDTVLREFDFEKALETYEDAREARTAGMAWFLAGIAHATLARTELTPYLTDVAADAYRLLEENQGRDGIFGHAASARFPRKVLHARFGTFRDQVSAIYALSTFARAYQIEEPLESALACANSICALQGDLGQWWFLYDKHTGRVVNRYPVLSANQDGIAPSALLALGEATGRSFDQAIRRGISWVTGKNEIGVDIWSEDQSALWDSIDFGDRTAKYRDAALSFVHASRNGRNGRVDKLKIRREVRPDHFGWLLYAFGDVGISKKQTLVAHA